jgi:hypothetical protein
MVDQGVKFAAQKAGLNVVSLFDYQVCRPVAHERDAGPILNTICHLLTDVTTLQDDSTVNAIGEGIQKLGLSESRPV